MSLRTDYTGSLDTKLAEARTTGRDSILITNLAFIQAEMAAASAKGLKQFTVTIDIGYQPQDIRTGGNLWSAYQSGIQEALHSEDLMNNDVVVELNTDDTVTTKADLVFTF